jgi:glycosyltransferase involved in cell wall biosynthesis
MILMSIIIPTKDRASTLEDTLNEIAKCRRIHECELIICNDGSTDNTQSVIEDFKSVNPSLNVMVFNDGHKGVAAQRNRAAGKAKGQVLLFAADDIRPESSNWLASHIELHSHQLDRGFCVLGRMKWPGFNSLNINAVMQTIQGKSGEQFGYADLNSNRYVDWRFFYTSNLSVKKILVDDWETQGFSLSFNDYGYEDIEFAYRLSLEKSLKLFYTSMANAFHFQEVSVSDFCKRQLAAGRMAATFTSLHPELRGFITPKTEFDTTDAKYIVHVLNLFEGLRSYLLILEMSNQLGAEAWHTDLLHLSFECQYLIGIAENTEFDNQGHLVFAFRQLLENGLADFSRNVSMRNLGINVETNLNKSRDGFILHLFGHKVFIPRKLFALVMGNRNLRNLALIIKNRLGGRLS